MKERTLIWITLVIELLAIAVFIGVWWLVIVTHDPDGRELLRRIL